MKKLFNFINALDSLKKYAAIDYNHYSETEQNLMLTGFINHYEKTFELSWKICKQVLFYEGVEEAKSGSPLQIIKLSLQYGLIEDEELWRNALSDRNQFSHHYDPTELSFMAQTIREKYVSMFEELLNAVQRHIKLLYQNNLIPQTEIDDYIHELCESDKEEFEPET